MAAFCGCLALFPLSSKAAMYSYVDAKGVYHYTNVPGDGRYKLTETPVQTRSQRRADEDRLLRTIASKSQSQATKQLYDRVVFAPGPMAVYDYNYSATPQDVRTHIHNAALAHQVDPMLIKAVIKAESNFNPNAISRKGAQGLMQLMPGTARDLKVHDPFDVRQNIFGGTRYLRQMLDLFGGDVELSLAAYNAGPNRVAPAGVIPRIPETQAYVAKVLRHYKAYRTGQSIAVQQHARPQKNVKKAVAAQTVAHKNASLDPSVINSIKVQQLVTVQ
ncbi:MAG: lytic transglycosylase domain-containing protein [Desulfobulbaceae bacterium]|nr:lytic transglycosylase domain-containing protein [Desulfobulbaceae bacterium]